MVAYSFKKQFAEPIVTLKKRQTVRGNRARHARPGEPVQLYSGMRTKYCVKLLDRDPICLDVRSIEIVVSRRHSELIAAIWIDGVALDDGAIEGFAMDDGFYPGADGSSARENMGRFWDAHHDGGRFHGVVIRWEPTLG